MPFQSTLPSQGATIFQSCKNRICCISIHAPLTGSDRKQLEDLGLTKISIHAPLTGSDGALSLRPGYYPISIHAPLTGSDGTTVPLPGSSGKISIHAPLTGSDGLHGKRTERTFRFQSTLPSQGATIPLLGIEQTRTTISIHAPLTGSDANNTPADSRHPYFNPRSPHRERQASCPNCKRLFGISIHAPLTGSDGSASNDITGRQYFNPRSPHRERPS